jgi:hypothetical protein
MAKPIRKRNKWRLPKPPEQLTPADQLMTKIG